MEYMFRLLARKSSPTWVLEGDIKGCFNNISHSYLLTHVPMDKKILKKFLTADHMYQNELFPTTQGAAQGGSLSPTLANMVLDGMEEAIGKAFWCNKKGRISKQHNNPWHINLVRYADDFIVTAENQQIAEKVKEVIKKFLVTRGLSLSEEKTKITNIKDGFDFLGWNFRKYRGKLIITPSKKSFNKIKGTLSSIIKRNKSSTQEKIILKLNQCIRGWTNYHHPVCAKHVFKKLSNILWNMLWKWAKRRHNNKGYTWIKNRYWKTLKRRTWIFMTDKIVLINPCDVPIIRHIPLQTKRNPFLDREYFEARRNNQRRKNKTAYYRTTAAQLFTGLTNA
jgi:RNA-directed DNA polymerase